MFRFREGAPVHLANIFLIFVSFYISGISGNTISTTRNSVEVGARATTCDDEFPQEFCDILLEGTDEENCRDSPYRDGCKRMCGVCDREVEASPGGEIDDDSVVETSTVDADLDKGCEDKIPNCSEYIALCCSMKEAMNMSCEKTCKFCTETPSAGQQLPGGGPVPTGSSSQDPCGSTNPPSVTADAPPVGGAPGQTTTTTLAPVSVTVPGGAG